eukprot:scaffold351998_cov66-Attheya_sp.AAC.1
MPWRFQMYGTHGLLDSGSSGLHPLHARWPHKRIPLPFLWHKSQILILPFLSRTQISFALFSAFLVGSAVSIPCCNGQRSLTSSKHLRSKN